MKNGRMSERHRIFVEEMIPHMDSLYNYAYRLTNESNDAKDLIQETYLKAYRFFDRYENGSNPRAWLFRIMKNSYINNYRKKARHPYTLEYNDNVDMHKHLDRNNLSELLYGKLMDDDVCNALASLPEVYRSAVILHDLEEWSYEELAEFFSIPLGTVRSRLHRARKLLAEKLLNYAVKYKYEENKS